MAIKSQIYTVSSLKLAQKIKKQDPVSIMQKTDLTNFSPFLVWKWVSHMVVITGGSQKKSSFVLGHFRHGDNQPTEQTAGFYPSASLFSSSEKVVFCKKKAPVHSCRVRVMELWSTLCYMFFILRIADNLVSHQQCIYQLCPSLTIVFPQQDSRLTIWKILKPIYIFVYFPTKLLYFPPHQDPTQRT